MKIHRPVLILPLGLIQACTFLTYIFLASTAGCTAEGDSAEAALNAVKKGEVETCGGRRLESLVEGFLGNPSWKVESSTDKKDTVSLSGQIKVEGKIETATLLFDVKKGSRAFELSGFKLNGQLDSILLGKILLMKMCKK